MDPISIIVTIAICIGALIALYFVFALIIFLVGAKKAQKFVKEQQDDFFNRPFPGNRR